MGVEGREEKRKERKEKGKGWALHGFFPYSNMPDFLFIASRLSSVLFKGYPEILSCSSLIVILYFLYSSL